MGSQDRQVEEPDPVVVLGENVRTGAYVLRLQVARRLRIAFGRRRGGQRVCVPEGVYLYVGSAMGARGGSALAPRLLRHATRSQGRPPHRIRPVLGATLEAAGLGGRLAPPDGKRLFWHVDYLLDSTDVELTHALVFRSRRRLEGALGRFLAGQPGTRPLEPGLGASDVRGSTHLLRLEADVAGWRALVVALVRFVQDGPAGPFWCS